MNEIATLHSIGEGKFENRQNRRLLFLTELHLSWPQKDDMPSVCRSLWSLVSPVRKHDSVHQTDDRN